MSSVVWVVFIVALSLLFLIPLWEISKYLKDIAEILSNLIIEEDEEDY
jgi:hypothetical protein